MSNDLFTPILLHTGSQQDQKAAIETAITNLTVDGKTQIQYINEELGTIPIETVRSLIEELGYSTPTTVIRVFGILAAEQLTLPAQHALLKSLEEPPTRTLIILVSSQPQSLLGTIQSRCVLVETIAPETTDIFEPPETIKNLIEKPNSVSLSQCIELAEMYKDRGEAIALLEELIRWIQQSEINTKTRIKWQEQLLATLHQLKQNANVQLTVEACFFRMKN